MGCDSLNIIAAALGIIVGLMLGKLLGEVLCMALDALTDGDYVILVLCVAALLIGVVALVLILRAMV